MQRSKNNEPITNCKKNAAMEHYFCFVVRMNFRKFHPEMARNRQHFIQQTDEYNLKPKSRMKIILTNI